MRLLDEHPDVTALIAPQEQSVIGVIKAAQSRGTRIPEELSVIGIVGDSMAEVATPPLTTISFPAEEIGGLAARILLERIELDLAAPQQAYVEPTITIRGSTGRAHS